MAKSDLSEEARQRQRNETAEIAAVLRDDLAHIRNVVERENPTTGDVRRLSGVLRRLLVYEDLQRIAAPRVGKILIPAPDVGPIHRSNDGAPIAFAFADEAMILGVMMGPLIVERGQASRAAPDFRPGERVDLTLYNFTRQRIIGLNGKWATRADVIKYVANVASGVHSGAEREPADFLLRAARTVIHYRNDGQGLHATFDRTGIEAEDEPITVDPTRFDVAIAGLLSTAQHLTQAKSVEGLEAFIAKETTR